MSGVTDGEQQKNVRSHKTFSTYNSYRRTWHPRVNAVCDVYPYNLRLKITDVVEYCMRWDKYGKVGGTGKADVAGFF
jgi:hypothetical protein